MKVPEVAAGLSLLAVIVASLKHFELDDPGNRLALLDRFTMCMIGMSCIWGFLQATPGISFKCRKGHRRASSIFAVTAYALQIWHVAAYSIWKARSRMWINCFSSKTQPLLEILLALLAQRQLYQQRILPIWATLIMATIHSTLLAAVAAQHLGTAVVKHLLSSFICTTVVPFVTHIVVLRCAGCSAKSLGTAGKQQAGADGSKVQSSNADFEKLDCTARLCKQESVTNPEKHATSNSKGHQIPSGAYKGMQDNRHARQLGYSSRLVGRCSQVSIKLHTNTDMKDLPPDLADQLQLSLGSIYGARFRLNDMAIRHGCILLRADMFDMKQPQADDEHSSLDGHNNLSDIAQVLLPTLQQLFNNEADAMPSKQRVWFQQGDTVVHCHWDESASNWVVASQQAWKEGKPSARLGSVRLSSCQTELTKGAGKYTSVSDTAVMEGGNSTAPSSKPACSNNHTINSSKNLNTVNNKACHMAPLLIETTVHAASGLNITGWSRPNAKHTDMQSSYHDVTGGDMTLKSSSRGLQVLVCAHGEYFETEIVHTHELKPNMSTDSRDVAVTVRVNMPLDGCQHHLGQSPPNVQLLTLELWSNELLISSSSGILAPTSTVHTSRTTNNAAARQVPCWWWGSKPATVTAAVAELSAWSDNLAARPDKNADSQYTDLFHDVSIWMAGVRHLAQSLQGNCHVAMPPASVPAVRLITSALSNQELLDVGTDLIVYAQCSGMHQLSAMLQQQAQLVRRHGAGATPVTASHQVGKQGVQTFLRRLRTSVCGASCPMCEQFYRQRLSRQLANAQTLYMAFSITIAIVGIQRGKDWDHFLMMMGWTIPQLFCCYHHVRHTRKPAGRGARECCCVCAFSFLAAAVNWGGMATGLIIPPKFVLRVYQSWMSVPVNLTLAMFEQLPSAILLPAPLVTGAAIVIAICQSLAGVGVGYGLIKLCLNVTFTVIVRLLADMHLRAMLMSPTDKQ